MLIEGLVPASVVLHCRHCSAHLLCILSHQYKLGFDEKPRLSGFRSLPLYQASGGPKYLHC